MKKLLLASVISVVLILAFVAGIVFYDTGNTGSEYDIAFITKSNGVDYDTIGFMNDQGQMGDFISLPPGLGMEVYSNSLDWSPDGKKLVFQAHQSPSYNKQIYTIDANGLNLMKIDNGEFSNISPKWSPDGKKIAFLGISFSSSGYDIFIYNLETQQMEQITTTGNFMSVAWSPDSSKLAFDNSTAWNQDKIGIMDLANGNTVLRTFPGYTSADLEWNPESDTLIFVSFSGYNDIYSIRTDGSGLRKLTEGDWGTSIGWAARYKDHKILYKQDDDFFFMNFDGSGKTSLHHFEYPEASGYSPAYRFHSVSLPDLIVTSGVGNLITDSTEPTYRVTFQIKNIGSAKSSETQIYLNTIDLTAPTGVNEIRTQIPFSLEALEPGTNSQVFTHDFKLSDFHAKDIEVINIRVDPKNSVYERNEQNNAREWDWTTQISSLP